MTVKEAQQAQRGRSEWLCYVAFVLTSGFFAWIWILLLANDVNRATGRRVFPITALVICTVVIQAIYLSLLFLPRSIATELGVSERSLFLPILTLALSLLALLLGLITAIYRQAKLALGEGFNARDAFAAIGLSIVMFISLIMVQQHVNRWLTSSRRSAS